MTKIIAGILLSFYLIASSNVTINLHYCCDVLVDVAINGNAGCGHEKGTTEGISKAPCCADDLISIEAENHVPSSSYDYLSPKFNLMLVQLADGLTSNVDSQDEADGIDTRAGPPDVSKQRLYLLHSSFVFYG